MHTWGPEVQVMNGGMREALMAMVNSMKLEESCCLSCPLLITEATACKAWFSKSNKQHPKSHKWHCIDYEIMRKSHRRGCLDVSVMRRADCNTDHRMLRMKLIVGRKRFYKRKCKESSVGRWDAARLKDSTEDARG